MSELISENTDSTKLEGSLGYRVRHAISTGMQFISTSVEDLSTARPDLARAMRMYAVGAAKIKAAIDELDQEARRDRKSVV